LLSIAGILPEIQTERRPSTRLKHYVQTGLLSKKKKERKKKKGKSVPVTGCEGP
jgi:hypothetical protein